ncbi:MULTISPECIES: alpha-ketoacid dehydrogenase subunit beta [unclassified Haladaptatus]|uniref:alpha-ketoacid dehydrogenase subunit beta n=1 Tax=unclassified Haladaptatus TaxID=2622732 RepID=UPI00209C05BE|nr:MULTISPECIES: alpha-ketoacid dehydrogenase subunit beta [unclassified Haladaptatus]MCO8243761.1 alpha-ketoacid dehydrogenase subunit beta [Haladaptatus sp. AB643]MCO8256702.1 alpha-ketoacid dehydrogenase subunit beta [Haladaptatus sp. AB618]
MQETIVGAINDALHGEMADDDRVLVFGEDVAESGGVFRATDGLKDRFGGERVVDTPLSEIAIVGGAVGLAAYGFRPVAEIQFSGFLTPAFDQLVTQASRMRWRTRGEWTAPLVVRTPYGAGVKALEHHSESLEGAYGHVPGLKVVVPSTPRDAKGLLIAAIRDPDPVLFMEPKHVYRSFRGEIPEESYEEPLGTAAVRREGSELTVISWGAMMRPTMEAVANLGVDAEIIDLRTISPLDHETVVESVKKTGRALVVHEAARTGGFGSELVARINDDALYHLEAPVERVTGFDVPVPLLSMEDYYLPNPPRIEEGIRRVLDH